MVQYILFQWTISTILSCLTLSATTSKPIPQCVLIFLCSQEMKELAALAYRDTTQENREFWKNELGNALREIQSTYDEKLDLMKGELETYYNLKVLYLSML